MIDLNKEKLLVWDPGQEPQAAILYNAPNGGSICLTDTIVETDLQRSQAENVILRDRATRGLFQHLGTPINQL